MGAGGSEDQNGRGASAEQDTYRKEDEGKESGWLRHEPRVAQRHSQSPGGRAFPDSCERPLIGPARLPVGFLTLGGPRPRAGGCISRAEALRVRTRSPVVS